MFGTRYEILRHVLREAEAYTNRIRGSRLQRVVPLKITNVPPSPSLNMFVTYGPSNTSESSQEMKNHKFRNLRSYRGWLKIMDGKQFIPRFFPSLIIDHPYLMHGNRVFEKRNLENIVCGSLTRKRLLI